MISWRLLTPFYLCMFMSQAITVLRRTGTESISQKECTLINCIGPINMNAHASLMNV